MPLTLLILPILFCFYIFIAKFLVWPDNHFFVLAIEEISYFYILIND